MRENAFQWLKWGMIIGLGICVLMVIIGLSVGEQEQQYIKEDYSDLIAVAEERRALREKICPALEDLYWGELDGDGTALIAELTRQTSLSVEEANQVVAQCEIGVRIPERFVAK